MFQAVQTLGVLTRSNATVASYDAQTCLSYNAQPSYDTLRQFMATYDSLRRVILSTAEYNVFYSMMTALSDLGSIPGVNAATVMR